MSARTPAGRDGIPVAASTAYTATAQFRAATTTRDCRVLIRWYDGASALISTTTGSSVTNSTSAWTDATATATSPSTAAFASVVAEVLQAAASEVHYIDKLGLFQGSSPTWVPHDQHPNLDDLSALVHMGA